MTKRLLLASGPLAFGLTIFLGRNLDFMIISVLAVTIWMLLWWLTEVVHLAVTAILPILLFPLLGVAPIKEVASNYAHPIVYLFFGGFVLALAIEKWNLHKRIALNIIHKTGTGSQRILLGFMLATAFLSMWISNTATTVMMLPIALSVIELFKLDPKKSKQVGFILLISVAWAANIGGIATLIGTPPNLILSGFFKDTFNREIGFTEWLIIGVPSSVVLLFLAFFFLRKFIPNIKLTEEDGLIESELKALGKMSKSEKRVAWVFFLTACTWILRPVINKIQILENLSDATIALTAAIVLFILPAENKGRILEWKDTEKLAWGILILFGGGLALAYGLSQSGLLGEISNFLSSFDIKYPVILILLMAVIGVFVTELVSNMALVAALLPLVLAIAESFGFHFLELALPVVIGASCAFMLPMATPPNAIVFASGKISIHKMAKYGLIMNLISVVVITVLVYFLGAYLL